MKAFNASAIMQFFSVKGQQNCCTTHELLYSRIYCANEKLSHSVPDQELGTTARTSLYSKLDFITG